MKIDIFYFSGTGNALHIARELQQRMPESRLVQIVHALKSGNPHTDADMIGLVFPIYATTFPDEIKQFIQSLDYKKGTYIFAVSSRKCRTRVFSNLNQLLQASGGTLSAACSISMPQNYLPVFDIESPQEIKRQDDELVKTLDEWAPKFLAKQPSIEQQQNLSSVASFFFLLVRFFSFLNRKTHYFNLANRFYTTDDCTACGLCTQVCLSDRIRLEEDLPVWDADIPCRTCLACVHFCPVQAIQIKGASTEKKGRYTHSGITAQDIAHQK